MYRCQIFLFFFVQFAHSTSGRVLSTGKEIAILPVEELAKSLVGCKTGTLMIRFKHSKKGIATMAKRIPLSQRTLPTYTHAEEITNMVTHIIGGAMGVLILIFCAIKAGQGILPCLIYGISMILVYTISSIYHGMPAGTAKKVLQVLDHCTIYLLIAGTYTPITVLTLAPAHPAIGWGLTAFQWILAALAITLTAIDLRKYRVFSMICYIGMGWSILLFVSQLLTVMPAAGFAYLLSGGIVYTVGAILYGIGSKVPWIHSIFHVFVVAGSFLQFLCIYLYVI